MRFLLAILVIVVGYTGVFAQKEKPMNYRKFDQRLFHFGFMLGGNTSDFAMFHKVDAYNQYGLMEMYTEAQPGGQLGILTTLKLGTPIVRLRFIPTLSFQERVVKQLFIDPTGMKPQGILNEERINSTSLDFPLMLQFRTLRVNNFAAYCLFGAQYSLDLQSQEKATQQFDDPFLKIRKHDFAGQVGVGVEYFAPFFKFGVELKYSHSFRNGLIQDNTRVSIPIERLYNKGWWISFIFEG